MIDYSTYEDTELLVLLKEEGNTCTLAFEEIWYRYSNMLMYYCSLNSNTIEDAEDLLQNTWIRFYEVAKEEKKIESIKLYLFRIAYNLYLKKIETEKVHLVNLDQFRLDKFIDEQNNFLKVFENKEILSQFNLALNYLDFEYKECLILHWIEGFTINEIAQICNETYDCIRMRCSRGMQKILTVLEPNFKNITGRDRNE